MLFDALDGASYWRADDGGSLKRPMPEPRLGDLLFDGPETTAVVRAVAIKLTLGQGLLTRGLRDQGAGLFQSPRRDKPLRVPVLSQR